MDCLEQSLESCVGGTWLRNYSDVVLEHGVMDKKCGVCRKHDYAGLERALHGKKQGYNMYHVAAGEVVLNLTAIFDRVP